MAPNADPQARRRQWMGILVAGALFMENLDATIITTALPHMAHSFGVRPVDLSSGISAYLIALAVFIPISGWIAERAGARRTFAVAIAIFAIASALCAVSSSLDQFILARVLQGIGGAMMVPVGRMVILRDTPKKDLIKAIALLTWPAQVAPILGPPVGGLITTHWSWHWIFLINVPVSLLGLAMALKIVPNRPGLPRRFDFPGFLLCGGGLILLMFGLDIAGNAHADWSTVLACLGAGTVALVLAVRHLRQAASPLIDLSALRYKTFRLLLVGGTLIRMAINTAPLLLPLLFQIGFGWSAVQSGMLLLVLFAGNLSLRPFTSRLMRRFGFRRILLVNGALTAFGFLLCAALTDATPLWLAGAVMFFCGLCRSMQFTSLNTIGFVDVPQDRLAGANTLFSVLQQTNTGMGIAFGAVAVQVAHVLRGGSAGGSELVDFRWALVSAAVLALLSVLDVLRLPNDAGMQVRGAPSAS